MIKQINDMEIALVIVLLVLFKITIHLNYKSTAKKREELVSRKKRMDKSETSDYERSIYQMEKDELENQMAYFPNNLLKNKYITYPLPPLDTENQKTIIETDKHGTDL